MNNGKYLHDIFDSLKDEPDVLRKISDTIVRYSNMTPKELEEQIKGVNRELKQTEKEKQFVIDVYKSQDCSKLVSISKDGTIQTTGNNPFIIKDENLKEKVLSQIYFKEKGYSKEAFGKNVKRVCDNLEQDSDLSFGDEERTALDRKKSLSAIKVMARENGYMLLNSLEECESGNIIPLEAVKAQKGEKVSFKDLKNIYQKFDIFYKDDDYSQLYVKDRRTGKEITDPQIKTMGKFAAIWGGVAGTKWMADEEIKGITYAFNEPSERIFNKLGELVGESMRENGTIDTEEIYKTISEDNKYKHSEEIARNLLFNPASLKIVYDFYRMQNDDARMETKLAKTTSEVIYDYSMEDSMVESKVEDVMKQIPDFEQENTRAESEFEINEFGEIIRPEKTQTQEQRQSKVEEQESEQEVGIGEVKKGIWDSKIATREKQSQEMDIKSQNRSRAIFNRSRQGGLSQEEQRLLEENERQRNQAIVDYRNEQDNRSQKRKGNGLEM